MNSNGIFDLISAGGLFDKQAISEDIKLFQPKEKYNPANNLATKVDDSLAIVPYNIITQAEEQEWCNLHKIKLTNWNENKPVCKTFSELNDRFGWNKEILENINKKFSWKNPSLVQQAAITVIDAKRDMICLAPTGSGKTAAYLIPVIGNITKIINKKNLQKYRNNKPIALILVPTRELCAQVANISNTLYSNIQTIFLQSDKNTLEVINDKEANIPSICVSTPLLLINFLTEGIITLENLQWLIMDEADLLMEDQFIEQMDKILQYVAEQDKKLENNENLDKEEETSDYSTSDSSTSYETTSISETSKSDNSESYYNEDSNENNDSNNNDISNSEKEEDYEYSNETEEKGEKEKEEKEDKKLDKKAVMQRNCIQKCMFSASFSEKVYDLSSSFLRDPVMVKIGNAGLPSKDVDQKFIFAGSEKFKLFTLKQVLNEYGKPPILVFVQNTERAEQVSIAISTETNIPCAALHAGLNHKERLETIRKFRMGEIWLLVCTDVAARGLDFTGISLVVNYDLPTVGVTYLHRVGRTGRQKKGTAVSIYTEDDACLLRPIANAAKASGCDVPESLLKFKTLSRQNRKKYRTSQIKRNDVIKVRLQNKFKRIKNAEGKRQKWSIDDKQNHRPIKSKIQTKK